MIRKATIEDVSKINNLGNKYDPNFEKLYIIKDYLDNVFVSINDEIIEGFLITEKTYEVNNIILLYVAENYRCKKVATKLLDYFISELTPQTNKLMLEVSVNNTAAISLYKKFGFEVIYIRKKYYHDGSDAYIMERVIINE